MAGWRILTFFKKTSLLGLTERDGAVMNARSEWNHLNNLKGITWCQHIPQENAISQESSIRSWLALKLYQLECIMPVGIKGNGLAVDVDW